MFCAIPVTFPVVAGRRNVRTGKDTYCLQCSGGCFCMKQLLHPQSGVTLGVSRFCPSVCGAYSKSLSSATLSSFAALCAMLVKPDACERS